MDTFHQCVDDGDEIQSDRGSQDGTVITDADQDIGIRRRPIEISGDQLELVHRRPLFAGAQLGGRAIEQRIDVLVAVDGAKTLGEIHGLIDDDLVGHVHP